MLRRIAPTLPTLSARALLSGLTGLVGGRPYRVEHALAQMFPRHRVMTFGSGRMALVRAILVSMRRSGRSRIVLPAYGSYSLAAAATAAHARVDLCDLDPETLGLHRESLARIVDHRTAAVVLGNVFGLPDRTDDLGWLHDQGVLIIDDAAQAVGAHEASQPVGARGDFGVLSFGRGKCATLGSAGALLLRDVTAIEDQSPAPAVNTLHPWLVALSVFLCRSSWAFTFLSMLPGADIGGSSYNPGITERGIATTADAMAIDLVDAVASNMQARKRAADLWLDATIAPGKLTVIRPVAGAQPAYLRLALLARSADERRRLSDVLRRAGFPYVYAFPRSLGALAAFRQDCGVVQETPLADDVAARLIALPCHRGVTSRDVARASAMLGAAI